MALRTDLGCLVVDDMSVSRNILFQMLERFGVHRVEMARDAREALALSARARFQLVISDLQMPGMDGVELLRRFRSDRRMRDVRFILTSALDASPRFDAGRALGLDAILVKPFEAERLLAAIEEVAGRL